MLIDITNRECLGQVSIDSELKILLENLGFENSSWHNDLCASYTLDKNFGEKEIRLWIDYDKNKDQEILDNTKYGLSLFDDCSFIETFIQSDKASDIIEFIKSDKFKTILEGF